MSMERDYKQVRLSLELFNELAKRSVNFEGPENTIRRILGMDLKVKKHQLPKEDKPEAAHDEH